MSRWKSPLLVFAPLLAIAPLVACAPKPTEPAAGGVSASTKSHSDAAGPAAVKPPGPPAEMLPSMFTAEQIRDATPQGTRIELKMEANGQPTVIERWTFVKCTDTEATIASSVYGEDGSLLEDQGEGTSTWTELQAHAVFPAAATERTEGTVDVPAGHFDTLVYTVKRPGATGQMETHTFHFAKTLPGPPVLYTVAFGDREIRRMTMLSRQ